MTEITVRHEPATGTARIEIRGADISETRFRLRDPASDKYLTKRGWTKTASFLPVDSTTIDGASVIALDADLARKILAGATLSLEQPGGFQQTLVWPAPLPVAGSETLDEEAPAADTDAPDVEPAQTREPEPLMLDSFEPSIMHDRLHEDEKTEDERKADPVYAADNDNGRSTWKPTAIAAGLFFVLGLGIGYFWLGSDSAAIRQVRQTAAMQLEKQKWEFDRQLTEAKAQASNVSLDKSKVTDAEIASLASKTDQLAADRAAAQKTLADKEKSIAALQKQLTDANAQIEAVKNAAGDEAKAQIGALDQKITALTAELETARQEADAQKADLTRQVETLTATADQAKLQLGEREAELKDARTKLSAASDELASVRDAAKSQAATQNTAMTEKIAALTADVKQSEKRLAERDAALRDVQAQLSVANIQVDALKVVAGKTTEAGLEKTAMAEKLRQMTAELDKTSQNLSDREQALTDANARLRDAETRLAAAGKRNDQLVAQGRQSRTEDPNQTQPATDDTHARLQEERDLYANELKTMTGNFAALQAQKAALEKTVADLQSRLKETNVSSASRSPSRAIWGATAIDRTGAIYSLQNQTTEKVAQDNVAAMCRGKSRSDCEALTTYSNACFSVARFQGEAPASDNYAYFVNKDWKTASATALERCQSMGNACTVRFTACSPDALSKPVAE